MPAPGRGRGWVSGPEGCLLPGGGGPAPGGGIPACTEADPPVNRMTDRCKNITFAISLRTVIKNKNGPNFGDLLKLVACEHSLSSLL